ncbi:hypothetical protein JMN32_14755 [Fulvivirga sp. 29W222]|uniref:Erythromycin biosynthesis protein CIII-like C-terminal domain-containing protein n=1 Tax=Fulvivirga marina TaxID=2494733 RepID=A0A937FZX9_9BACT|nr:nucleotide disphospho-sugar-binding domain-containing protein [Fulvivirga marina]MBL6447576.1 hypothetical protein [Fulvivirga marina]
MKATIVILMFPERGALNASFQLASQLRSRGHEILYLTNDTYADHVRNQQFNYRLFDLNNFYDALIQDQKAVKVKHKKIIKKVRQYLSLFRLRNQMLESFLDKQFEWLNHKKVDLLLLDPILFNCSLPFLKRCIPIAHLNTTFASYINYHIPPVFSKLIPSDNLSFTDPIIHFAQWVKLYIKTIIKDLLWHAKYGLRPTRTINTLKGKIKRNGGKYKWGEYGYRLITHELVLASSHLEFCRNLSTLNHTYIGSSVYLDRKEFESSPPIIKKREKLMYCSLGSYSHIWLKNSKSIFQVIIEAMRDKPEWDIIIQVGDITAFDKADLPQNIQIVKFINQIHVLQQADIAVTHTGCSSYKECAFTGTPMIIIPWNNDGYGNSARAVYHKLGMRINMKALTSENFKKTLELLMLDESIRKSVEKKKRKLIAENDCRFGIKYIESVIRKIHNDSI